MKQKSKYKKLAGNSLLFAVGNLGSKLISFFMLPLYTLKLSQGDFGISDLIITTVSLLLPIVSLSVFDSVLRFSIEPNSDKKTIFTNSMFISLLGSMILLLCIPVVYLLNIEYGIYIVLILINQLFQMLFSQYAKAIEKIRMFAVNGIIISFLTASLNLLFLVVFNFGIQGYLLSILLANVLSNMWFWAKLKLYQEIDFSRIDKKEMKRLLIYSVPLIPNSIAWWITNTISRYFILYFIGTTANGIFAVANKIPSLLSVLNTIFFQAWQLSAIEEFGSKDSSKFYSKIFSLYSQFLFLGTSVILFILKPMMNIIVSSKFQSSWEFVPFLLLTVVYSSFAGFLGNYYAAAKKTTGVFTTTVVAAFINILGNLIFIPLFGLMGAGISSSFSFLCLWIIRQRDTKKFVETRINFTNIVMNHVLIFFQMIILFTVTGKLMLIIEFLSVLGSLFVNKNVVFGLLKNFIKVEK